MMLNRISIIAALFFFLLGTNAFAAVNHNNSAVINRQEFNISHTLTIKAEKNTAVKLKEQTKAPESKQSETYVIPSVIGVVVFLVLSSYWVFFRKKLLAK